MMFAIGGVFLFVWSASGANLTVDDACPPDALTVVGSKYFRVRGDYCFLFMTYDKVVYEDARRKCMNNGGTLAMPKTKDVNDFLLEEIKSFGNPQTMWIGMHDKVDEGTMVWEDGTEVKDWGNFAWGNGGFFGGAEDCVGLNPDGKWHDYGCSNSGILINIRIKGNAKLPFICQYPVDRDTPGAGSKGQDADVSVGKAGQGDDADVVMGQQDDSNGDANSNNDLAIGDQGGNQTSER
ncbi:hypothetical protein EGW08_011316 [Elysia chlorotica]|uniref:C-type lectin domain-containing protein n=1 Tax=Elysia chlorotica TaxID=188477 RepID=A0A3S0ZRA8_ELYCH|nr:hypothetical protein EGW08_011316 [Elysia chlorotica]